MKIGNKKLKVGRDEDVLGRRMHNALLVLEFNNDA
jgi:hypothetical protein